MSGAGLPTWVQAVALVCALALVVALKVLTHPRTARTGNLVVAGVAAVALVVTLLHGDLDHRPVVVGALLVGGLGGLAAGRTVPMALVPQAVAALVAAGGAAVALTAVVLLEQATPLTPPVDVLVTVLAAVAGSLALAGSLVLVGRLRGVLPTRPVSSPVLPVVLALAVLAVVVLAVPTRDDPATWQALVLVLLGLVVGALLVLPLASVDLSVALPLLNAVAGVGVAALGYALGSLVLLVAGALVAATGAVITALVATAMARPLGTVLLTGLRGRPTPGGRGGPRARSERAARAEDVAIVLGYAERVVVVPGYGLAMARAHHTLRELGDALTARGVDVVYAVHPVAGRVPGHMGTLLDEAEVPREQVVGVDRVNAGLVRTDVVLVVGANDVVNPAARTTPSAPVYGMTVVNADEVATVVVLKRSTRPGYAGIDNELLHRGGTTLLLGDLRASLARLLVAVNRL